MTDTVLIFTDGSSLEQKYAGCAVYYPEKKKMFSCGFMGTNNIAELLALKFALTEKQLYEVYGSTLRDKSKIEIYSDSEYAIRVVSGRYAAKKNIELVNECKHLLSELQKKYAITFYHCQAHTNKKDFISRCNDLVDKKAREQAIRIKEETSTANK